MYFTKTLLLLASTLVPAFSVPVADAEPADTKACIVPQIFFTSLAKPFTLAALTPGPSTSAGQASIPVRVTPPPTKEKAGVPIISRAKIASTSFQLVNGTLVADGFAAHTQPSIAIFPPPLTGFDFGGLAADNQPAKFGASYACDSTGKQILRLVSDNGSKLLLSTLPQALLSELPLDTTLRVRFIWDRLLTWEW